MTQAPAGSREWVAVVSDKTIINGFACLVSFSESGREWNGQQLSFKLLFCPVINQSYSSWLLLDSWAETTLNQARTGVNVEGQPRYTAALVTGRIINSKFPQRSRQRSYSRSKWFSMAPITLFLILCTHWDHSCKQLLSLLSPRNCFARIGTAGSLHVFRIRWYEQACNEQCLVKSINPIISR